MPIAKITTSGLSSIALLVVLLWGCIVGEHMIVRRANHEYTRALNEIRALKMKKRNEPAATPVRRWKARPLNPTIG
jgi:hypothetical protein